MDNFFIFYIKAKLKVLLSNKSLYSMVKDCYSKYFAVVKTNDNIF